MRNSDESKTQLLSEISFGEMPAGRKFRDSSLFFPVSIAAQAWGTFVTPQAIADGRRATSESRLVFPVNFPVFGRRVCTRLRPPPTSPLGVSLCYRMTCKHRIFPRNQRIRHIQEERLREDRRPRLGFSGLNSPFAK